ATREHALQEGLLLADPLRFHLERLLSLYRLIRGKAGRFRSCLDAGDQILVMTTDAAAAVEESGAAGFQQFECSFQRDCGLYPLLGGRLRRLMRPTAPGAGPFQLRNDIRIAEFLRPIKGSVAVIICQVDVGPGSNESAHDMERWILGCERV